MNREQALISPAPLMRASPMETDKPQSRKSPTGALPLAALLLILIWTVSEGEYYKPGDDFGYWLGVAGGVMMLTLLLYSLRKHIPFMRNWGPSRHWFRMHMILGVTGPTLILFHSTFQVGSLNAAVALACMLLVAGSGVIGRFIYRKIHHGLYGRSATLQEVQVRMGTAEGDVKAKLHLAKELLARLKEFEAWATAPLHNFRSQAWRFLAVAWRARRMYSSVIHEIDSALKTRAEREGWDRDTFARRLRRRRKIVRAHLDAVVDVARFHSYERLFSLWHILHVPFVFMLVISGIVHVIAVHMY